LLGVLGVSARGSSAQEPPAQETPPPTSTTEKKPTTGFLAGAELRAESIKQLGPGDLLLEGAVTISSDRARMQADRLSIREERYIEAEGNVLVVWLGNRISGTRMTYDLEEDRGVIENAIGQVEPEFYFTADRAEKIGADRIFLDSATVTTCTQPVPYWSFSVSSAKIRIDHYARMWNLRLRALHVPVFYLPYMVWPVKRDRAAGLLLPKFGSTRDRGDVITEAFFLPLGDSADVTLFGEYYTKAGWGGGGEFELIPNRDGAAHVSGFYIQDRVAGFDRYRLTYKQTQTFVNGFRMIADVNQVGSSSRETAAGRASTSARSGESSSSSTERA
jgi:LPS-assembly protein